MSCLKQFFFFFLFSNITYIIQGIIWEGMVKLSTSFGREKKGKGVFLVTNSISLMSIYYLEFLELILIHVFSRKFYHVHILSNYIYWLKVICSFHFWENQCNMVKSQHPGFEYWILFLILLFFLINIAKCLFTSFHFLKTSIWICWSLVLVSFH